jgi:hypothetical protein
LQIAEGRLGNQFEICLLQSAISSYFCFMLRPLVAIFTVIYFAVSSGVVMNVHYCMGKRQQAEMDAKTCKCGRKEKKGEKKGCCKTESKFIKLEDVQKASYAQYTIQAPVADAIAQGNIFPLIVYHSADRVVAVSHSPPLLSAQDTYLLNCVFRI